MAQTKRIRLRVSLGGVAACALSISVVLAGEPCTQWVTHDNSYDKYSFRAPCRVGTTQRNDEIRLDGQHIWIMPERYLTPSCTTFVRERAELSCAADGPDASITGQAKAIQFWKAPEADCYRFLMQLNCVGVDCADVRDSLFCYVLDISKDRNATSLLIMRGGRFVDSTVQLMDSVVSTFRPLPKPR